MLLMCVFTVRLAYEQLLSDLRIAQTVGHQLQNVDLALGEAILGR
jgi:hypothetical protein